jgi:hypothetical protein
MEIAWQSMLPQLLVFDTKTIGLIEAWHTIQIFIRNGANLEEPIVVVIASHLVERASFWVRFSDHARTPPIVLLSANPAFIIKCLMAKAGIATREGDSSTEAILREVPYRKCVVIWGHGSCSQIECQEDIDCAVSKVYSGETYSTVKEIRKRCKPIEMGDVPACLGFGHYWSEEAIEEVLNYFRVDNREDGSDARGGSEAE